VVILLLLFRLILVFTILLFIYLLGEFSIMVLEFKNYLTERTCNRKAHIVMFVVLVLWKSGYSDIRQLYLNLC
jgi:hypothetical protein